MTRRLLAITSSQLVLSWLMQRVIELIARSTLIVFDRAVEAQGNQNAGRVEPSAPQCLLVWTICGHPMSMRNARSCSEPLQVNRLQPIHKWKNELTWALSKRHMRYECLWSHWPMDWPFNSSCAKNTQTGDTNFIIDVRLQKNSYAARHCSLF